MRKPPLIVVIKLCGPSLLMFYFLGAAPIEEVDLLLSASADVLRMMLNVLRAELPHTQMLMEINLFLPIRF